MIPTVGFEPVAAEGTDVGVVERLLQEVSEVVKIMEACAKNLLPHLLAQII